MLTTENQVKKDQPNSKNDSVRQSTNESGFDENDDDDDEWTDIDDDEE